MLEAMTRNGCIGGHINNPKTECMVSLESSQIKP